MRVPVAFPEFENFVARGARARAAAQATADAAVPGCTFGELVVGETFWWAPPIPRGGHPILKTGADGYEFPIGTRLPDDPLWGGGLAEPHYAVARTGDQLWLVLGSAGPPWERRG
jgi:hypothetical protein